MDFGAFENTQTEFNWVSLGSEDRNSFETKILESIIDSTQEVEIDQREFTLKLGEGIYPIATSRKIDSQRYIVAEKWINPYWKSKNRFYYPSAKNPIGKYLILLANFVFTKIIPYGIHSWPNWEFESSDFVQGFCENPGCIRIKPEQIEEIFNKINLGARINII